MQFAYYSQFVKHGKLYKRLIVFVAGGPESARCVETLLHLVKN